MKDLFWVLLKVKRCSDVHALHWGGQGPSGHLVCQGHRDLPPLPHHDALHHLSPPLQVNTVPHINTKVCEHLRLEHPSFGVGGGEVGVELGKVEERRLETSRVMSFSFSGLS